MLNILSEHIRLNFLFACFFFLPVLSSAAWAVDATPSPDGRFISPNEQFNFAEQYFLKGEYDRAAAEYERFVYFFPQDDRIGTAKFGMGKSFYEMGEYDRAKDIFAGLIKAGGKSTTALDAYFEISRCYVKMNDPQSAVASLEQAMTLTDDAAVRDRALSEMGWIFIETTQWDLAGSSWNRITPENRSAYAMPALLEKLKTAGDIPQKNPKAAGFLSVLPGGGYFYCNRYKDALTAFLLNGGLIWAAISSFENDNPALGGVIAFVETGFYGGNIYGGINCAHKYNKRQTKSFIEELKGQQRMRISMDFEKKHFGLVFEKKF